MKRSQNFYKDLVTRLENQKINADLYKAAKEITNREQAVGFLGYLATKYCLDIEKFICSDELIKRFGITLNDYISIYETPAYDLHKIKSLIPKHLMTDAEIQDVKSFEEEIRKTKYNLNMLSRERKEKILSNIEMFDSWEHLDAAIGTLLLLENIERGFGINEEYN